MATEMRHGKKSNVSWQGKQIGHIALIDAVTNATENMRCYGMREPCVPIVSGTEQKSLCKEESRNRAAAMTGTISQLPSIQILQRIKEAHCKSIDYQLHRNHAGMHFNTSKLSWRWSKIVQIHQDIHNDQQVLNMRGNNRPTACGTAVRS